MNLLEQIARHIEMLGHGTVADETTSGNIFYGRMPDFPDECICVFSHDSGVGGTDHPARIQVFVRGLQPKRTYEWSQAIANDLDQFQGYLAGDGASVSINTINASVGLGEDGKKRQHYSSNFEVYYCDYF